jgi:hypothetical protein
MGRIKKVEIGECGGVAKEEPEDLSFPCTGKIACVLALQEWKCQGYAQIVQEVGYERHAVGQWFKLYREKGLKACLQIET